ncbi:MAG: 4-hydroxybenzoate octaprenyltransferase [Phycisphaerales bacterium]|nr:4-hydroxybenzoate octaprenyltransferase [Phycisphaerales bacterium]
MGTLSPSVGWLASIRHAAADIKLAHSVFAMPFAVLGAFLARDEAAGWGRFAGQLALVVACMVLARSWAMLFNRIADARLDAMNERTRRRAIPAGRLRRGRAWAVALGCAALFILSTSLFQVLFGNPWPLLLAAPVLAWVAIYSLTKRFTALCHLFLGGALAASPVAAAIAVDPAAVSRPTVWLLAGMVAAWVAGFDVIYALQDLDFDRGAGLRSIPARLGWRGALWVSRGLHLASLALLVLAARSDPRFGGWMTVAVVVVGVLLTVEHMVLVRRGRAGLDVAFFTVNGLVSCVLGLLGSVDLL